MTKTTLSFLRLAATLASSTLLAQPAGGPPKPLEVQGSAIYQFEADLDQGGAFSMTRAATSIRWSKPLSRQSAFGLNFGYSLDAYDFASETGILGADPWGDIHTLSLGASYFHTLDSDWRVFASPSISSSSESALDGDSLLYSLVAGASKELSEGLKLGLGAVAITGLEEVRVFPFVSVEWEISENWTLQNPLRPGPAGPAGLELEYAADAWSASIGFAYRSWRFRIDGQDASTDGIAEYSGLPLFARYTLDLSENFRLDLYGGVLVGGELELEDDAGNALGLQDDVDTAPFLAFSISGQF